MIYEINSGGIGGIKVIQVILPDIRSAGYT